MRVPFCLQKGLLLLRGLFVVDSAAILPCRYSEPAESFCAERSRLAYCFGMRPQLMCGVFLLSSAVMCGAGVNVASLTNDQVAGGLKEALSRGITTAVSETGRPGGFENNPLIRIAMPPKLHPVEQGLRAIGMGSQVDGFEHSMNAAAEEAAPRAKAIFTDALRAMTFDDAKGILTGGNTAGTEFFKRTTSTQVSDAFRPVIEQAMAHTGVSEKFGSLMGSAPKLPFGKTPTFDINAYVLQKSVDGMFTMMGEEEKKIRTNPAAQVTPLLKTVFGRL
jgi:hypothetical protein